MRRGLHSLRICAEHSTCKLTDRTLLKCNVYYWRSERAQYNQVFYFHKYREKCFVNFILKSWMEWNYNGFGAMATLARSRVDGWAINLTNSQPIHWLIDGCALEHFDAAEMRCTNVKMHMVYAHNAHNAQSECIRSHRSYKIFAIALYGRAQWENCASIFFRLSNWWAPSAKGDAYVYKYWSASSLQRCMQN